MGKKNFETVKRHFTLTLDPDLMEPLWRFYTGGNYHSMSAAICALLRMSFAADINQALLKSGRIQAYNETRHWMMGQLAQYLRQMGDLLETSK